MGGCLSSPSTPSYDWYNYYYNDLERRGGNELQYVPRHIIDVDLCIHAIKNGLSLEEGTLWYFPQRLYGDELFLKMIQVDINNIRYIPKNYINRVIVSAFFNHQYFDFSPNFYLENNPHKFTFPCINYIDFSIDGVADIFFNTFKHQHDFPQKFSLIPKQCHTWVMYDFLLEKDIENQKYIPLNSQTFQSYLRFSIFKEIDLIDRLIVDKDDAELLFKLCIKSKKYQTFYLECFKMFDESFRTPFMYNYLVIQDLTNFNLVPDEIEINGIEIDGIQTDINADDIITRLINNTKNIKLDMRGIKKIYQIIPSTHPEIEKVDVYLVVLNETAFDMIPNERRTLSFFSKVVDKIYNTTYKFYENVFKAIPSQFYFENNEMCWQIAQLICWDGSSDNFKYIPSELRTNEFYRRLLSHVGVKTWEKIVDMTTDESVFTDAMCDTIIHRILCYAFEDREYMRNPRYSLKTLNKVPKIRDDDYFKILNDKHGYEVFMRVVPTERKTKEFYLKVINYIFEHNDTAFFDYVFPELKEVFKDDLMVLQNILLFQRTNVLEKKCDCERKCQCH
jgi:hypothetical protein